MGGRRQGRLKAGRGLLSTKHRTCYLRHRWPGPKFSRQWCPPPGERPSFGDFPWTSKESHPAAGRDRRSSAFNLPSDLEHRQNRRVASRQTPYFLSKRQQKVSKKCLRLAAGTPVAADWRFLRSVAELIAVVFPCKETFAGLPPALSRGLVSRTSSAGVCNSRAILLNDPPWLAIGTDDDAPALGCSDGGRCRRLSATEVPAARRTSFLW
jgi:hypothetical protein